MPIELVTQIKILYFFYFELVPRKWKNSTLTQSEIVYKVEFVTQKKDFHKNFEISKSKCDVILRNLISLLDFVTQELSREFFLSIVKFV